MTRITTNNLLNPTIRTIKNWNSDFRTSDGPNTSAFINLGDLGIPYDSHYVSRLVLPAGAEDYYLNYGLLDNLTFLLIKVTYNGNYDYPMEDNFDPLYWYEPNNYNITYYYEDEPSILYPIGRLLILNGSFNTKLTKIYLNNPLDSDVVLDVLHANIDAPKPVLSSSAITISNLYYSDIITNQVICSGTTTGSTAFIINQLIPIPTGYTILSYIIPYDTIISFQKDISIDRIYIYTTTLTYTLKFLTDFDCNQAYSRMVFAYTSYSNNSCRYLTEDNVYDNGLPVIC